MTNTLIKELIEARKNRNGEDTSWINDLPDLPDIPEGDQRQAIMVPKRGDSKNTPEVQRHGKHIGQEGRKGEKGGSVAGYTHADGAGTEDTGAPGSKDKETDVLKEQQGIERFTIEQQKEAIDLAAQKLSEAEGIEPEITQMLEEIRDEIGGELEGLEYRLKSQSSIARKLLTDMDKDGISLEYAKDEINDANRYTFLFDTENYVDKVLDVQESLASQGWKQYDTKWKNFFRSGDGYDGYNTVLVNDAGSRFELQFHTPETIKIKSEVHISYEAFRILPEGAPKRKVLFEKMQQSWMDYEKPSNWENLPGVII